MSDIAEKNLVKDYEREPVPEHKRKGWFKLSIVWLGGIVALSAIVLGGTLAGGLSMSQAIIATLIGTFLLACLSALCSVVGAKTNLSTAMVSTFALGQYGAYAVSVVIALSLFGWFGVQLDLFGTSLAHVIDNTFGVSIPPKVLVIVGGILMTTTAVIGYKAIEKLSLIAVPLLAILIIASLIRVGMSSDANQISDNVFGDPLSTGVAVSLIIGSLAVGAIIGPDISRYARSTKDAVISSFVGYFAGFSLVLIASAILAKFTTETDIVAIMLSLGWGTAALLVLILAQWTTNDNNLYSSALGFSAIFKNTPKFVLTIFAGVIGTSLAVGGIYDNFIPFLNFLSALIPPIGGVYVADYLLNKEKYTFENFDYMPKVNLPNVSVWAVAAFFAFLTTPQPNGFGLFTLTGASGFDAFLVAFILQLAVTKFTSIKTTRVATN
ncbi:cytosine permease [Alkalibacillus salilacus]|uniref:Cytosine permease n=1 Tax=Alkalibacillus salilacus TaxID=284582 RepID=A0ABT9VHW2_9BACI|nr:cytosine permease [Alkalibacillus salilacus]MDQ0160445.1 cytosine permease [Alkalibacillus salilacus]